MFLLKNDWRELLKDQFEQPYFQQLTDFLIKEYETNRIYPKKEDVFNAFHFTSFQETKVVILGQDPYHREGQANGLSFSVNRNVKIPPSLKNIYKELECDLGYTIPNHGCLKSWAKQGVLLLNTTLTVKEGCPNSHQQIGWDVFTDHIISLLNKRNQPLVFILWGRNAAIKKRLITSERHFIIEAAHPSPLSANRGFFGSSPFSKTNQFLRSTRQKEINWEINNV